VAGPPRIAGLFMDLDPTRKPDSVRVLAEPDRFIVSWSGTPAYQNFGSGRAQTFRFVLYPDGRMNSHTTA